MEMINLLPPEEKRLLAAARTNTLLLRYSMLTLSVVCLLVLEVIGMNLVVDASSVQNKAIIAENEKKTADYSKEKKQADQFTADLKIAKSILSKQISYTTLIFTVANCLPQGSTLESLSIDPTSFGTSTILAVRTDTAEKAIAVKTALQNVKVNNTVPLFTSVSFKSVIDSRDAGNVSASAVNYPFTVQFDVIYSKDALTQ